MIKNPKAKGARNELKSKRWYERRNYMVVKSGGSLGIFDLICFSLDGGGVDLVQVKSNRKPPTDEMDAIRRFPALIIEGWRLSDEAPINAPKTRYTRKVIHVWKDYAREPEIMEVL